MAKPRKPKKPKTRKVTQRTSIPQMIETARSATAETAPSMMEIITLFNACDDLVTRFVGHRLLLWDVVSRGDDCPPSRALVHARTSRDIRESMRVVEGVIGREAERIHVINIIERVAELRTTESLIESETIVIMRATALAQPYGYIRESIRHVLPELALRASDEVLKPALEACEAAGPGKRNVDKWGALSNAWYAMTRERISPNAMRVAQSAARDRHR